MTTPDRDRRLHDRLYVSLKDIWFSRQCAEVLVKKNWHKERWEARQSGYMHQSAYTTALVIAYSRPFTKSKEWPAFPERLLRTYETSDMFLHRRLLDLRDSVYAHSDSARYRIMFWAEPDGSVMPLERTPSMRIDAEEAAQFLRMTAKLVKATEERTQELLAKLKEGREPDVLFAEHAKSHGGAWPSAVKTTCLANLAQRTSAAPACC